MKTVSELAKELNVNRTTLHRLIQRNNIETLQEGNKRLIDAQAEQAILRAFGKKTLHGETLQSNSELLQQRNVAQAEQLVSRDKTISLLQSELDESKSQLTDRDKTIESLQAENNSLHDKITDRDKTIDLLQSQIVELKADKAKLNERLDKAETNISNLTTALTAAQALHGMDKQQAVIEVKADDAAAPESEPEIVPEEPEQKQSFFARLFRKK